MTQLILSQRPLVFQQDIKSEPIFHPETTASCSHSLKRFSVFFLNKPASYHLLQIQRSRNKQMKEMFPEGFGIHHASMLRSDRSLMESMFSKGHLKVLVCTATLAWGVNLPAHAVIIKVLLFDFLLSFWQFSHLALSLFFLLVFSVSKPETIQAKW